MSYNHVLFFFKTLKLYIMNIFYKIIKKVLPPIKEDIVVIDCLFPQKEPFGFRNIEINGLIDKINLKSYTMYRMKNNTNSLTNLCLGMKKKQFIENKRGYLNYYPKNVNKVLYLKPYRRYSFLSYSYFLLTTYILLPFYEENKIPFIFVLYPGGGFGLNNNDSDKMLEHIFKSPYFRKVIVTQEVTKNYLIKKQLCSQDKMEFLFGGYPQYSKENILPKKLYPKDKNTFDICFVAAKYSEKGIDKGYDLFIEVAKYFVSLYDNIHFHVIGGFDENEIDVSDIKNKITFYGYLIPDNLKTIYSSMDICISPNRLYQLYTGNFDGFPLGVDTTCFAILLMTTDELNNNAGYYTDDEIVIIKPDLEDIINKIDYYYHNLDTLYNMARNGQTKTFQLMSPDKRIIEVSNILKKELSLINQHKI